MKYIIIQPLHYPHDRPSGDPVAIVFPDNTPVSHRDVASLHRVGRRALVSAGFCCIKMDRDSFDPDWVVRVWGKSKSLDGMESRPEDADIIRQLMRDYL